MDCGSGISENHVAGGDIGGEWETFGQFVRQSGDLSSVAAIVLEFFVS